MSFGGCLSLANNSPKWPRNLIENSFGHNVFVINLILWQLIYKFNHSIDHGQNERCHNGHFSNFNTWNHIGLVIVQL